MDEPQARGSARASASACRASPERRRCGFGLPNVARCLWLNDGGAWFSEPLRLVRRRRYFRRGHVVCRAGVPSALLMARAARLVEFAGGLLFVAGLVVPLPSRCLAAALVSAVGAAYRKKGFFS